ncbi:2-aminoethylphosphonate--pyruvate transaminase [Diaphorobacter caeni]|uniref:2-aminoethylphosphonate--pyruvate transaminase n=1 Tax=Diaphorobacter caeni TaxID=2784387 RepID=UPI00188FE44A|nr:2-aminoethylphosphonate--pyruvate transaminase [Diaphorobacter caeni]MBF5004883.1 2-aminoethylphosphonate--pyruvate transaminase [Diaphorobacter caeni]
MSVATSTPAFNAASSNASYPVLLTPGPLTTSERTREAMLRDWGSWDADFNQITARIRQNVLRIVNGEATHECVPMQGSGTFSVEAAIGSLVPRSGRVLVPNNGAYCARLAKICKVLGRKLSTIDYPESQRVSPADVDKALAADASITHVALVHCETGAGVLNPLHEIALVVAKHGRGLIVDAMSSFGAIDIDARKTPFDAVIAASGKCLEGVPGMGFVIARRSVLEQCEGHSHSLAMDLHDQWVYMGRTTQWRFTPPTHVVAALDAAITQYFEEGGLAARGGRYERNCKALMEGMRKLGFRSYLDADLQAPIIVTFHAPDDPAYDFKVFYQEVKKRGYILYPGKLTAMETFRVGCIGHFGEAGIPGAVAAIADTLKAMGIRQVTAPAVAA